MPVVINPHVINNGIVFPGPGQWMYGDAGLMLLGAVIFVIALVFRKEIKNQKENELTV